VVPGDKLDAAREFRRASLRLTPQRYAVFDRLLRQPDHPTAQEIFQAINRGHPRASRATVYNNLHALVRAGLVRPVVSDAGALRYDLDLIRHHHFICEWCGRVEDVPWFELSPPPDRSVLGARIVRNCHLVFRGLCETCSNHRPIEGKEKPDGKSSTTGSGKSRSQRRRTAR
jgi:Fur family peroxide stress response transcriptional regulator